MKCVVLFTLVAIAIAIWGSPAFAQAEGDWEIGFDLGLTAAMFEGDNAISLGVPATGLTLLRPQTVRAGYWAGTHSEIEPRFGFGLLNVSDHTAWTLELGLDYVHNFGATAAPFVRVGPTMWALHEGDESHSQFGLGVGAGSRQRLGDNAALRLQAGVSRFFENSGFFAAHTDIEFSIGLSVFAK